MLYTFFNVIYVLVAVAMTAFILLQQGSGSAAGSGFGAGASATVFGARGSANFLSKSTAILATIFFVMALGSYPQVPLASRKDPATGTWTKGARELREDARQLVQQGIDRPWYAARSSSRC